MALRRYLRKEELPSTISPTDPVSCQFSSFSQVNRAHRAALNVTFNTHLGSAFGSRTGKLQFVFPTTDVVRNSLEGWFAGEPACSYVRGVPLLAVHTCWGLRCQVMPCPHATST